ncbi:MAG: glutamate 5-kinase [Cellvibrionales bacterium]|nr:glutamate 5-kinase [Porticoccaceae bacterium]
MTRLPVENCRRWVVKIGSALLTDGGNGLNRQAIDAWVEQIDGLLATGKEIVLVSSGAIAEGLVRLQWARRPESIGQLQAAAAVGQMGLIEAYQTSFQRFGRHTAQILLDHDDIASRQRYLNARSALNTLLGHGVVPIVNENDTVVTDEIRFGDNDRLAAMVANLLDADLLVILTDRDGLFTADPAIDPQATLITEAACSDSSLDMVAGGSGSGVGRGGMLTKLQAARQAAHSGCNTLIVGGAQQNILSRIAAGEPLGSLLTTNQKPLAARKQWLAGQLQIRGQLQLDAGAVAVLRQQGSSLLAVGVLAVEGDFKRGDLISCLDVDGREVARGLINYSAEETAVIKGHNTGQISRQLGYCEEDELIHRDNLVVLG